MYIEIMEHFEGISHNLLHVASSKSDPNFAKLEKACQSGGFVSELQKRNIVLTNTNGNSGFTMTLYGRDGQAKCISNNFDDASLKQMYGVLDSTTPQQSSQKGGSQEDYKEKYLKYKQKYMTAKSTITKLY